MSDNKDVNPEMAAKIAAIKARMKGGGGEAPAAAGAEPAASQPPAEAGGGAGDKAAQIAAIKARMAGGKAAAPAAGAPAAAAAGAAAAAPAVAGGEDLQARIAALKAKVEAGKGAGGAAAAAPSEGAAAPAAGGHAKPAHAKKAGGKNIFPVEPINRTTFGDERLYGDRTVTKVFIVAGLALLVAVIMMWGRDHVRGWKPIQRAHRERQIERLQEQIAVAGEAIDAPTLAMLDEQLGAADADLAARAEEIDTLQVEVDRRDGTYYKANQKYQIAKSEFDALRYEFEEMRLLHGGDEDLMAESQAEIQTKSAEMAEMLASADEAKIELDDSKAKLAGLRARHTELTRQRDALVDSKRRLEGSLGKIEHNLFNDYVRNAPVADMLAPTLKVQKIVLDEIQDNYNFMYVDKVDMCITCHTSIDDPYYTDWDPDNSRVNAEFTGERVLNAHPRLDLFVGDKSPHPMADFGCTVCHQGRGQAVEFERTFHTPTADAWETAEEKEARWVADYGYDPERHYWDWPMTSSDKLYESCFQCHQDTDRLPGVPEYNQSRALVEDLGCYGCHKISSFEHLRKRGPDLTNIAQKTSEEWSQKWAMAPREFRPTTRMPHFWNQSNTGGPGNPSQTHGRPVHNNSDMYVSDWRARNAVEARAVVAYLFDQSRKAQVDSGFELAEPPARAGNPDTGRQVFEARGCLGCHSVAAEEWTENQHGPDLSAIGSKVTPEWLYTWIRDPKSYFKTTVMPDLRLTDDEAWDVTAWLMSLRDPEWEARPAPVGDQLILESIAVENLASVAGDEWAREQVAAMRAEGGDARVEVFVGEKLFNRYGCAGCHLVPGHYEDVGIGTELTYESLKELSKFDFGHEAAHGNPEAIGHSREAFYRHKLTDPRVYDRMPVIVRGDDGQAVISHYDQKVKLPGEKLKMPDFGLDPAEVELVTQFLLGLRQDGLRDGIRHHLDGDAALVEQGSRLITKYNCIGCHKLGQSPQRIELAGDTHEERLAAFEALVEEGLDHGVWMSQDLDVDGQRLLANGDWLLDEYYDATEEADADLVEFFEDESHALPDSLLVYGPGEGAMGNYIDDAAMRPPVFRNQGAKVNPDWLFEFLIAPYVVRTHVNVRMPTFGLSEAESLALVRWFSARSQQPWPFTVDADAALDQELYDKGLEVFNQFQCNSCHPSGATLPSNPDRSNWGPDLALAKSRLKPGWIHDWLKDPQELSPGTRMPNFLGEIADGEYTSYYDDWEDRIQALQHYLKHMDAGGP